MAKQVEAVPNRFQYRSRHSGDARQLTNVTLGELKRFLHLPAAGIAAAPLARRRSDDQTLEDDEPLVTTQQAANALVRQTIERLVRDAAQGNIQQALAGWPERFTAAYADSRLRSRRRRKRSARSIGRQSCATCKSAFTGRARSRLSCARRAGMTFCGPVLLGETLTPLGAKLRFPALALRPGHELPADAPQVIRLIGSTSVSPGTRRGDLRSSS